MTQDNKLPILGVIAGYGTLPNEIAQIYTKANGKIIIAAIESSASENNICALLAQDACIYQKFPIGAVGKVIQYFKTHNVQNVMMVGKVHRPDWNNFKVDLSGSALLAQIVKNKILGDDNVLRVIAKYFESQGLHFIGPQEVLASCSHKMIINSHTSPSRQDNSDITLGKKLLYKLGDLDVGQSVIINNGYVIGIEAAEGTDNLIIRSAALRPGNSGGVLVKMAKSGQDIRLDAPAIGPKTIEYLAKYSFNGIAIEKNNVIIADLENTEKLLNKYKLFLLMIDKNNLQ